MDTSTVLEIIKMLDTEIDSIKELMNNLNDYEDNTQLFCNCESLEYFRNHLQSFIESQLNSAENSAGE